MIQLSTAEVAQVLNVKAPNAVTEFNGVSIDSRTLSKGNLFVAIKGAHCDAHHFIKQAEQQGATALLLEYKVDSSLPQIIVADTCLALGSLARYWRGKFSIPIVGITGSAGKTTTKQMLGAILSECANTLISEGNKNNYFGVPLTLFHLGPEHRYAVVEMGANQTGEITYLVNIVQPEIALITNIAAVHLEVEAGVGFASLDGVFREKTQVFALLPAHSFAILNADDNYFAQWQAGLLGKNYLSFGLENKADLTALNLRPNAEMQYNFDLITPIGNINLTLSSLGKHNVMNALAASAAALAIEVPLEKIKAGLENVPLVERRMIRYLGKRGALIIDDSYNANVKSVPAVMEVLANFAGKKRIMIFGDMREIGASSLAEHYKIGQRANALGLEYFYAYGDDSIEAVKAFGNPNGEHFTEQEALINKVLPLLDEHSVVVVKGSLSMKMNNIVMALKAN